MSRNALALDLDRDGFTINAYAWYRARRYLWTDVGDFGTRPFHFITLARYQDRQQAGSGLFRILTAWGRGSGAADDAMAAARFGQIRLAAPAAFPRQSVRRYIPPN